jgi:hypothetical protein
VSDSSLGLDGPLTLDDPQAPAPQGSAAGGIGSALGNLTSGWAPPQVQQLMDQGYDQKAAEGIWSQMQQGWTLPQLQQLYEGQQDLNQPGHMGFMEALSMTEDFAAQTGWAWHPTMADVSRLQASGVAGDQNSAYQFLARSSGMAGRFPWLAAGMTKLQYQEAQSSLATTMFEYTGDLGAFKDLQSQALASNWSPTRMAAELQSNSKYWGKAPWLQEGMTYRAFQDFKTSNKQQATERFGAQALTDANYIALKKDPGRTLTNAGSAQTLGTIAKGSGGLSQQSGVR